VAGAGQCKVQIDLSDPMAVSDRMGEGGSRTRAFPATFLEFSPAFLGAILYRGTFVFLLILRVC
jgi:hypothetical protein